MMYPLVLDLAADSIPVAVTCRVLGFSKQAFYQWKANPVSQRDWDDAHLINAAMDIHHDDPEFGYRFITDELAAHGIVASRNRVNRLCTQQQIFSNHAKKRGLSRKPGPPVHDDLVERRVHRATPEPAVADRHHRAPHRRGQAVPVRGQGRLHQPDRGLLHGRAHDLPARRGRPNQRRRPARPGRRQWSTPTAAANSAPTPTSGPCARRGLHGSMGRVGACADNAAMESFFSLLQKNVLNRRRWATRDQLRLAILTWIEKTYHRRRRQDRLGRLTPIEFETLLQAAHAA